MDPWNSTYEHVGYCTIGTLMKTPQCVPQKENPSPAKTGKGHESEVCKDYALTWVEMCLVISNIVT